VAVSSPGAASVAVTSTGPASGAGAAAAASGAASVAGGGATPGGRGAFAAGGGTAAGVGAPTIEKLDKSISVAPFRAAPAALFCARYCATKSDG